RITLAPVADRREGSFESSRRPSQAASLMPKAVVGITPWLLFAFTVTLAVEAASVCGTKPGSRNAKLASRQTRNILATMPLENARKDRFIGVKPPCSSFRRDHQSVR